MNNLFSPVKKPQVFSSPRVKTVPKNDISKMQFSDDPLIITNGSGWVYK